MALKKCNCCGSDVDFLTGGCALQLAFCRNSNVTLTNVSFCAECYAALVNEDLRRLNANANLQLAFGD